MLRILSLLLLSLVLLTTACSKDNPEPEPTLAGTWKLQRPYFRVYNANGIITNETNTPTSISNETLAFAGGSLTFSKSLFGVEQAWPTAIGATSYKMAYTRQDQTITLTTPLLSSYRPLPFTIVKLTDDTLEIQQEQRPDGIVRAATGGVYTK